MVAKFSDPAGGFFDTTEAAAEASSLPIRPKEIQDNAIPSGNALAAEALFKLAAYSNNDNYRQGGRVCVGIDK